MKKEDLPSVVAANVDRWSVEDDAWRGYHREDGRVVLDPRVERALDLTREMPGCDYLDVGCANGVLTGFFAERLRAGRVTGVDFVDMGLACGAGGGYAVRFCQANLDSDAPLPFDDATFDVVSCMETLEHLHDTDHMLCEIRRVLRPSGYAIVSVPRLDAMLNVAMLALGFLPPAIECSLRMRYGSPEPSTRVSGHVSHFTKRSLVEACHANGFVVDAFAQAGIYEAWRHAQGEHAPIWKRAPLWLLSRVPFKRDDQIVRVRPCAT